MAIVEGPYINEMKKIIDNLDKDLDEVKKTITILSERVDRLTKSLYELSREVGKLSDSFGFIIEDVARSLLPSWFYLNMNLIVNELGRTFLKIGEKVIEIDLYGSGFDKTGNPLIFIGEVKARIHGEDVKAFHDKVTKIIEQDNNSRYLLFMFGLYVHPTATQEASTRNIILISPYITTNRYHTNQVIQCSK
ncbi:MAG: hypothetical protein QXE81_02345 [Desulfurococcaceae archaeon]